jgi:hypothetical protein
MFACNHRRRLDGLSVSAREDWVPHSSLVLAWLDMVADFFQKEAEKSTQAIEPAQEWI